ncbi:hypothetical protein [Halapricum desulfuricans]|uniref:Uncharacterized protein n=1 Tax=Halapricum desulfuricans TaxID=2841257 RepID=A0A897NH13_9EURY|nr:hypothetical protein [Halapricum desulfuricans]QSG13740.1 hypothetical protein HSEST_0184 [Halapricum desulfuricans]
MASDRPPVHDALTVLDNKNFYRNEEWWKSVVRYQYEGSDQSELAIYLWHKDDGEWTRKNKYVIKTPDAWATDKAIVNAIFSESLAESDEEFPVSDYYSVGTGETVFKSDGWWKAIVLIDQKGSYETQEVMVYLWQETDDGWRRRQKYTIKDEDSWKEEAGVVESMLDMEASSTDRGSASKETTQGASGSQSKSPGTTTSLPKADEFEQLSREIEDHLSVQGK